jgi:ubiquinone/menaquinone biosynthesis C-methylase UbiE
MARKRSRGGGSLPETYLSDDEYKTYFETLSGMRTKVASELPVSPGMRILDVATGYGYFAVEVARRHETVSVIGIDLVWNDVDHSVATHRGQGLSGRVKAIQMDAAEMGFQDMAFDMAVNFLGLEDIHMTRGREGIEKVCLEVSRVLKPKGHFCTVLMPPDEMETDAQKTEVALYSYICDCRWFPLGQYEAMLARAGFRILRHRAFHTGKKLTPEQAKTEIGFAVEHVPRLFGRATAPYEDIWATFGPAIERHGLGQCSKTVLVVARKT